MDGPHSKRDSEARTGSDLGISPPPSPVIPSDHPWESYVSSRHTSQPHRFPFTTVLAFLFLRKELPILVLHGFRGFLLFPSLQHIYFFATFLSPSPTQGEDMPQTRVCRRCERRKPVDKFFRNTQTARPMGDIYRPECKDCTLVRRAMLEALAAAKSRRRRRA